MSLKNYDFATIMNAPYLEVNHPPSKKKQTEFRSTYDTPFMTQINLFSFEFNNLPKGGLFVFSTDQTCVAGCP